MPKIMELNLKLLIRWYFWFFFGNAFIFWLIGLNYFFICPSVDTSFLDVHHKIGLNIFTTVAYLGHLGLLAFLPGLIFLPLLFTRKMKLIFTINILFSSLFILLLVVDIFTYKLYRFHLNRDILHLAIYGFQSKIWDMSWVEGFFLALILLCTLIIEALYARWLLHYCIKTQDSQQGIKWIYISIIMSLFASYSMILVTSGTAFNHVMVDKIRFLPLYNTIFGKILFENGDYALGKINAQQLQPDYNNFLKYPLHETQCTRPEKPKNLLIIVIDTWRFDMLKSEVMPSLTNFAKQSWVFDNHFSGGNATSAGIFSIFYGIPAYYWPIMETERQGPVLIHELIKQNYQLGIFSSATLKFPAFNRTIFAEIKNLREVSHGKTPFNRDRAITREFGQFINKATQQPEPFFGFLFYDAAHGYCGFNEDLKPNTPAVSNCNHMSLTNTSNPLPYLNRYKNALLLIDQEINQVFETLKSHDLLKNTVVVITGDHGEEFNDNHLGFWGHASNFTHYQVQTPLIIYWPDQQPKLVHYQTTHFELVPTLMQSVLGCHSSSAAYSMSGNLLEPHKNNYLVVGSYTGLGIIEADRITNISSSGDYNIQKLDGQAFDQANLNIDMLNDVKHDFSYFYSADGSMNK